MTDLQLIKVSISILTSLDIAKDQTDAGAMLGYNNKSSFSQLINGKVPIPGGFIKKLRNLNENVNKFWEWRFGESNESMPVPRHTEKLITQLEERVEELKRDKERLQEELDGYKGKSKTA